MTLVSRIAFVFVILLSSSGWQSFGYVSAFQGRSYQVPRNMILDNEGCGAIIVK